ncbi:hypothetical protein ABW20_dc0102507 [Dactylellina cionopaga]|nr:hypothetical protein ABW20_dc0102507 [Dactylellina cionopaga]
MSQYQHINPTHGAKNTSDPRAQTDPKREFSGPVLKDSLAAESLESGGSFSKGNPTGILGVTAANSTLRHGDDTEGFRRVHDSEDVSASGSEERYQTMGTGKMAGTRGQSTATTANTDNDKQSWEGESTTRSMGSGKDDEFGGVNVVDRQPEIGSEEDPGRYAEKRFAERNTARDGAASGFGMGGQVRQENPFDALGGDRGL